MSGTINGFDVNILATGSGGNCTILDGALALDMGIPFKQIVKYLPQLHVVFISHEHGDHFKASTVHALADWRPTLRFCCGEFLAVKLLAANVDRRCIDVLKPGKRYNYGPFSVDPVELHHNVPCYGLKIYKATGQKALYAVDTGSMNGVEAKDFDLYLVEANHTQAEIEERAAAKLDNGDFAYETAAAQNHLSFEQAHEWLCENMGPKSIWLPMHGHNGK